MIPQRIKTAIPPQDAEVLQEMGLSPIISKPIGHTKQTPSQAKEQSVSELLADAFKKSSCIEITKEESEKLLADFDDADFLRGAAGNADLLYLDQQALRQRFNRTIGIGQWSIVTIRSWAEDYKVNGKDACRVYCEAALLIRGGVAGTAIGSMSYFKSNAAQDYSDAYEGAKTSAFRRCAKDLGVGLQCFSKDWCEAWKAKYGINRPERKS
jgi:hypothetical protein